MNLLSIAGSDPSTGAGIQSDVKTFTSLGGYALTAITSITSQNTKKFGKIEPVSAKMVKLQLDSIFSDFKVDAIKIGMVYNTNVIRAIHSRLSKVKAPIILDPVIKSTTGGLLLKKDALKQYKKLLIPLAYVITPNVFETNILVGNLIKNKDDLIKSVLQIRKLGAKNIIITGIIFEKKLISDFVFENSKFYFIKGKKINRLNHGSGCNFSAALTVAIANRKKLKSAVKFAKNYTYNSIKNSKKIGKGITITKSSVTLDENKVVLDNAINDFSNIKKIYSLIPECQTNFVFSKENTKSINDILGVSGRIVKSGKDIVIAGSLEYGGSKHVGSALLEVRKKFSGIRSAVNIRYDSKLITKCKKMGFHIKNYNRSKEPSIIKKKENSSISWGIRQSIKNSIDPPDIIYHTGDFGKEPMIIVFGTNPYEVVEKISKIL